MNNSRRKFLQHLSIAGASSLIPALSSVNARAQSFTDYKALICVFLYGGNDSNNMIVPIDSAGYAAYQTARSGLAIPQANLLPLVDANSNAAFGLHPAMTGIQTLWNQGQVATLFNTGMLVEPTTRTTYQNRSARRPSQLFSHSDQVIQWETSVPNSFSPSGWAGRIADRMQAQVAGASIPMVMSIDGNKRLVNGVQTSAVVVSPNSGLSVSGFSTSNSADVARRAALLQLHNQPFSMQVLRAAQTTVATAIGQADAINPVITGASAVVDPFFANINSNLARQLNRVAKLIEARATFNASRQFFAVGQGGYDTHSDQLVNHQNLLTTFSVAVKAFMDAITALGMASNVTVFTMSDFGRTLRPAQGAGTDHAWGSHQLIVSGAVPPKQHFGTFPTLALDGPDDIGREGRWVPTTSVDQYVATLANWFGVAPADMGVIAPNLGNFPTANLGFLV